MALKYPEVKTTEDGAHWWVLEKWLSPDSYGSPERWYLPVHAGGTMVCVGDIRMIPSQGDFPYEGAYEETSYQFPQSALTERVVITAIQRMQQVLEDPNRPSTAYGRMLRRCYNQAEAEKKLAKSKRAKDMQLLQECDTAFGNNPTSFGGSKKHRRSVNTFAERAGIKVHVVS